MIESLQIIKKINRSKTSLLQSSEEEAEAHPERTSSSSRDLSRRMLSNVAGTGVLHPRVRRVKSQLMQQSSAGERPSSKLSKVAKNSNLPTVQDNEASLIASDVRGSLFPSDVQP